jgi:osmotically-inducible protein OsmY
MAHLRERLAEDVRTNELDIRIEQQGDRILLRGEVPQEDRRDAVEQIATEIFNSNPIENHIRISRFQEPTSVEAMK